MDDKNKPQDQNPSGQADQQRSDKGQEHQTDPNSEQTPKSDEGQDQE